MLASVVPELELLGFDVVTGRRASLAAPLRRALRALDRAGGRFAVVGAMALGVRGLPRMTRDLDVVVPLDEAPLALEALERAGFRPTTPVDPGDPDPMYVLLDARAKTDPPAEVDLLVGTLEPESTVLADAPRASVLGVVVPVATLEHLALLYLYSNQPKHLGDFARVVTEGGADVGALERYLADVHPEMLPALRARVEAARHPPPPPERPPRRRRRPQG